MSIRLAITATHPIPYQVPLFRALAEQPDLDVHVFYLSDHSVRGRLDPDFGVPVSWDVPLLQGYHHTFLPNQGPGPARKGFFAFRGSRIYRELQPGRFDALLVPAYTPLFYLQAIHAARRAGIPVLLRGDNSDGAGRRRPLWKSLLRKPLLTALYKNLAAGLAVGRYMRRHFLAHGLNPTQIFDAPHCIDNRFFEHQRSLFLPQRADLRRQLHIPPEALALLFAGKLIPVKNPLLLARAIKLLPQTQNLYLIVMGDGPLRAQLQSQLETVLPHRVRMTGFVNLSQLGRYYSAADVLVLPSRHETWGLVVNEAMTFARPAIVSDTVGCHENLILPHRTGFTFPDNHPRALARCLQTFLDHPSLAAELGQNAHQLIQHYSIETNVLALRSALHSLQPVTRNSQSATRNPQPVSRNPQQTVIARKTQARQSNLHRPIPLGDLPRLCHSRESGNPLSTFNFFPFHFLLFYVLRFTFLPLSIIPYHLSLITFLK